MSYERYSTRRERCVATCADEVKKVHARRKYGRHVRESDCHFKFFRPQPTMIKKKKNIRSSASYTRDLGQQELNQSKA